MGAHDLLGSRNVVVADEVESSKGGAPEFPSAAFCGESVAVLPAAIDDVAIGKYTIPKGVSVEVDCDAFERFPCMDGHYESFVNEHGVTRTRYAPTNPKSSK
jgi:hypothetical protein